MTDIDTAALRAAADRPGHQVSALTVLALLDRIDAQAAEIERLREEHVWPKTTPTGHTYARPKTYDELRGLHNDVALAFVEHWDNVECPPEPIWEMVGLAHREIDRLQAALDRVRALADKLDERGCLDCSSLTGGDTIAAEIRAALEGGA